VSTVLEGSLKKHEEGTEYLNIFKDNSLTLDEKLTAIYTLAFKGIFKFKFKGFVRSTAGYISDILSRNLISFKLRWLVNAGKKSDPFDCYNFLIDVHKKERVEAIYFFC
jgi:hypothetical protein